MTALLFKLVGGNVPAKRTALAHVSFNLATGLIAVLLLPIFLRVIAWAQQSAGLEPGAMSLAAFHTSFIAVGVAIFLPFVHRFARIIERLLPEREPTLTRHLDRTVLQAPTAALEAVKRALCDVAAETFSLLHTSLGDDLFRDKTARDRLREALYHIQDFFPQIPPIHDNEPMSQRRLTQLHAIDHLARIHLHLTPPPGVRRVLKHPRLEQARQMTREILQQGQAGLRGQATDHWQERVEQLASELSDLRRKERPLILQHTAANEADPSQALELLDAMRWLNRLGYHTWRICNYLGEGYSFSPDADDGHGE